MTSSSAAVRTLRRRGFARGTETHHPAAGPNSTLSGLSPARRHETPEQWRVLRTLRVRELRQFVDNPAAQTGDSAHHIRNVVRQTFCAYLRTRQHELLDNGPSDGTKLASGLAMPGRDSQPDTQIKRLTSEVRHLRLKIEELVRRIRDERTAKYSTTRPRQTNTDDGEKKPTHFRS